MSDTYLIVRDIVCSR